jgi:hypothetical protein
MIPTIELLDPQNPADLLSPSEQACLDILLSQIAAQEGVPNQKQHFTLIITRPLPIDQLISVVSTVRRARFEMPTTHLSLRWNLQSTERQLFLLIGPSVTSSSRAAQNDAETVVRLLRTHLRPLLRR